MSVEDYLKPNGALEGLERLRRQGKARFIGFTAPSADPEAVNRLLDLNSFSMINISYNLLNPTAGIPTPKGFEPARSHHRLIDKAAARGVGVAVISPLGAGVLNDHAIGGGERHPIGGGPAYAEADRYNQELARAKRLTFLSKPERSLAQAAVQFILGHPGVTTVLGGYSEVAHMEEFASCSGMESLTPLDLARVEMVWRANFGQLSEPLALASANGTGAAVLRGA
jgi:L-glyceraldehyde 3-phosphate reductase